MGALQELHYKRALRSAFGSFVIWMQVTIVVFAINISVQLTTEGDMF